ncbi:macrophage erythroblast attacher [Micractinium conductrix]|uniref:Macrophage erythroblast attacher n=1 Tax=Micractinium conductrix TaxID=554055 RepID=A0A2P6VP82_9CHLO|nr:macrophage erythroblast attacher [Micractinium conductrix]|eukprot:PSC75906.1 macrophage erythroblast attacher [Micractinium conductrix]
MANMLDAGSVSVPFESLKRVTRERKYTVDEVEAVVKGVAKAAGGGGAPSADAAAAQLEQYEQQLQGLKRKLEITSQAETDDLARCRVRLQHLRALGPPPRAAGQVEWNRRRIDCLLVDHLLRGGYNAAASGLAAAAGIEPLVELHIFAGARRVVEALRAHDCGPALAWCEEQRARLRKAKSRLEFKLRVQEFVELVRSGQQLEAIAYARRHLAPWAVQYLPELQRAAALLAFQAGTKCGPYAQLFDDERWAELVDLFHQELYRLNFLPPTSLLSIHLQAGLSALKTPLSLGERCCREDPLHLPAFRTLAAGLPFAKHVHSKLICAITGEIMDEHNPPAALPNGYVYSQRALAAMAAANGGRITCPRTGFTCDASELRRVYIS